MPDAITALPYQRQGVYAIEGFQGRALLADEMGLGKTIQALYYLRRNPAALPAVCVCPASVKYNWEREAARLGIRAAVLDGRKPPRRGFHAPAPMLIINYDILGPWLDWLRGLSPQAIIVDECQYCQSRDTNRTKHVRQLCRGVPATLALSGTPLTNRPSELWPTLNILWPDKYPSFVEFAFRYCKPTRRPWGWEFKGAQNLDELHSNLRADGMIRRLKRDVLHELPDKFRQVVPMPLSKPSEYKRAKHDFLNWLAEYSLSRAKRAAKAEQLTQLGYLRTLAARLKYAAACQWVDDWLAGGDGKIVLFGVHTRMLEALHRRYAGQSVLVTGQTPPKLRGLAVEEFQRRPGCRLFIGNIQAAGVGLTLTAASTVAFLELDWRPGQHTQAEDRIHRIGQRETAWIYYLVAAGTIEEHLCRIIQDKQQTIRATLDGDGGGDGLDVFDQLLVVLAAEAA